MTSKAKNKATKKPRGRPALAIGENGQESILKAAILEFGRNGFDGANITEIAERANVAKPLVHYHFKSKENLWYSAVQFAMAELQAEMDKLIFEMVGMDPIEGFKLGVRRFAYFSARNPGVARMILNESSRDTERAKWLLEEYQVPVYQLFAHVQASLPHDSPFKDVPLYHALPMINGAINAFSADRGVINKVFNIDTTDPVVLDKHAAFVIRTLLHGLMTEKSVSSDQNTE